MKRGRRRGEQYSIFGDHINYLSNGGTTKNITSKYGDVEKYSAKPSSCLNK